ncbi:NADH-quinone oxidoreductase subunit C [Streptomyces sp. S399]|uniref:NADH-quinone oxidoreductase subunit C n=1 Tax=Streptomyces sp. S399 TaxID=3096009 RepID=UPI002A7FB53F|nr:NADH-quinone oxidoreductase subunit C [Streptomyces sp. S399]WPR51542.1 NADH-quinone oxidoreductase subunit C [Streptomyces sp. S399]
MTGWLPRPADTLFGPDARAGESYGVLTVDVPAESWTGALRTARSVLGCTFFDWLSAVDEPGTGFLVSAHLVALAPVRRLLLRTTVPHEAPVLESAVEVFAGAAWHERETHEMFGVAFTGHPALEPLLLPENFEGHPLRKDFVLAARVAKAWPGAKEPGEGPDHAGPKRRQMLPPGVPDPNEWGPLKGTLPAAPARRHAAPPPQTGPARPAAPAPRPRARPHRAPPPPRPGPRRRPPGPRRHPPARVATGRRRRARPRSRRPGRSSRPTCRLRLPIRRVPPRRPGRPRGPRSRTGPGTRPPASRPVGVAGLGLAAGGRAAESGKPAGPLRRRRPFRRRSGPPGRRPPRSPPSPSQGVREA